MTEAETPLTAGKIITNYLEKFVHIPVIFDLAPSDKREKEMRLADLLVHMQDLFKAQVNTYKDKNTKDKLAEAERKLSEEVEEGQKDEELVPELKDATLDAFSINLKRIALKENHEIRVRQKFCIAVRDLYQMPEALGDKRLEMRHKERLRNNIASLINLFREEILNEKDLDKGDDDELDNFFGLSESEEEKDEPNENIEFLNNLIKDTQQLARDLGLNISRGRSRVSDDRT